MHYFGLVRSALRTSACARWCPLWRASRALGAEWILAIPEYWLMASGNLLPRDTNDILEWEGTHTSKSSLTQKLVPYVMQRKGIKVVLLLVSECDCVCGGACHIEGSSRHNLPSRNEQACSPLRLNYMDPMSSGRPCGELGSTTAILVPPSTNFTHLSHRYYRSLISRCTPTTSAAKRPWGAPEVNYPAVTLSVVMVRRGKQKAHVYTW